MRLVGTAERSHGEAAKLWQSWKKTCGKVIELIRLAAHITHGAAVVRTGTNGLQQKITLYVSWAGACKTLNSLNCVSSSQLIIDYEKLTSMLIYYIKVPSAITHFHFETFEVFLHLCLPFSSLEFNSTKNTVWKHCLSCFKNVNIQVSGDVATSFHFYALLKSLSNSSWFMHTTAAGLIVHLFLLTHRNSSCLCVICSTLCFATVCNLLHKKDDMYWSCTTSFGWYRKQCEHSFLWDWLLSVIYQFFLFHLSCDKQPAHRFMSIGCVLAQACSSMHFITHCVYTVLILCITAQLPLLCFMLFLYIGRYLCFVYRVFLTSSFLTHPITCGSPLWMNKVFIYPPVCLSIIYLPPSLPGGNCRQGIPCMSLRTWCVKLILRLLVFNFMKTCISSMHCFQLLLLLHLLARPI